MTVSKQILFPSVIVMALLLIAIFPIEEYSYYVLLRWIVCLTAVYIAYYSYEAERTYWTWTMGIIALIFNPLIPFHLSKEIWTVVDFITATIFGITIFIFKQKRERIRKEKARAKGKKVLKKSYGKVRKEKAIIKYFGRKKYAFLGYLNKTTCEQCTKEVTLELYDRLSWDAFIYKRRYILLCPKCNFRFELDLIRLKQLRTLAK